MRHVASVVSGREVAKGCLESAAASGHQEKREIQKINDEESPDSDQPGVSFPSARDLEKSRCNLH